MRAAIVGRHRTWFERDSATRALGDAWRRHDLRSDVVRGFDEEWRRFADVGTEDQREVFGRYFDIVPRDAYDASAVVLDAGCGAGRWAYEVAGRGPRVIALDLGLSIEVARKNTLGRNVACVQADVRDVPLAAGSIDWAYSLGVLHHTDDPRAGLRSVTEAVRPGGLVLLYLYYALDQRGRAYRALFAGSNAVRQRLSRAPNPIKHAATTAIAASVYWPLARSAAVLEAIGQSGLAERLPLSFYRRLSFRTMRNDSLDRFGTALERRYSRDEVSELMRSAGLTQLVFSGEPPFWHATGRREAS
jgi:SAM-dependent methyltransferase